MAVRQENQSNLGYRLSLNTASNSLFIQSNPSGSDHIFIITTQLSALNVKNLIFIMSFADFFKIQLIL